MILNVFGYATVPWKLTASRIRPKTAGAVAFLLLLGGGLGVVWMFCPVEIGTAVTVSLVTPLLLAGTHWAVQEIQSWLAPAQPPAESPRDDASPGPHNRLFRIDREKATPIER
jgi:hypothetical protein